MPPDEHPDGSHDLVRKGSARFHSVSLVNSVLSTRSPLYGDGERGELNEVIRAASGECLGKKHPLLALALIRVLLASVILVQGLRLNPSPALNMTLQGAILFWAVAAMAAFILNAPRSKVGMLLIGAGDLLFAATLIILGAPVTGILLLLFSEIALRSAGWRRAWLIIALPYAPLVGAIWLLDRQHILDWHPAEPRFSDIILWTVLLLAYAWTFNVTQKRRESISRLGDDIWTDPILAAGQPFSYDFTRWVERLANFFGERNCLSLVAISQKAGITRTFSNHADDLFAREAGRALPHVHDRLPDHLSVVRDRESASGKTDPEAIDDLHILTLLAQPTIIAKRFKIGRQNGVLIIACGQVNDALLREDLAVIDQALDHVLDRVTETMDMRRAFLIEAREVARRDLHDGVLQSLAALRMRLLTIIQESDLAGTRAGNEIRDTAEIIALEQARLRTLLDHNVDSDQPINLVEALRLCVKTAALQWEIHIEFVCDDRAVPMHRESVSNVEYLVREAIANATKHSGSQDLRCALALRDDNLIISLLDMSAKGKPLHGNDFQNGPLSSHSLRQRLALVNGRAYSEGLQTGTLLAIAIPLIYDESD